MFWENTPSTTGHCCDTPCLLILPPPLSPSVESQIVGPIWKPKEGASQEHSLCPAPYLSEVKIQTRIWLKDCSQTQNTIGKIRGGGQDLKVVRHCVSFCVHFVYIICFGRFGFWYLTPKSRVSHHLSHQISTQHLWGNWASWKERLLRHLLWSWGQLSPFVAPIC